MPHPPLQSIDLFAGCGGLSTGLHLAGWKGLFAVERNPAAFSTLKANLVDQRGHFSWPDWLATTHWDIKTLLARKSAELAKLKGTVDLVVGGPPCQGFSTAGRRIEGDQRNQLVHSYLVIHYSEPRVMTVRECAHLQTFPDWFEFKGPYTTGGKLRVQQTPRYTQVGNAVSPLFATIAGLALKQALGHG
jgi:site-specific DNA-cytosine methylase